MNNDESGASLRKHTFRRLVEGDKSAELSPCVSSQNVQYWVYATAGNALLALTGDCADAGDAVSDSLPESLQPDSADDDPGRS